MVGGVKLLLDTYTVFCAIRVPEKLSSTARDLISDPRSELLVSAVTPWELATKLRIGKLPDAGPFLAAYSDHLAHLRADEISVSGRHAIVAGQLEWVNKDPFDRMLAAQAIIENAVLVSADGAFATLGGLRTAW
ncbi:type II toxin-antitoxin system VapC family toxin [soil metagenome]